MIIIIVQYIAAENVPFIVQFQESYNNKRSITRPRNIDSRITNNPSCIVYKHLIGLPITEPFSELFLLALNRVNNNRAIFELRLPIKIQSMPPSGLGKFLTLTVYSSVFT